MKLAITTNIELYLDLEDNVEITDKLIKERVKKINELLHSFALKDEPHISLTETSKTKEIVLFK